MHHLKLNNASRLFIGHKRVEMERIGIHPVGDALKDSIRRYVMKPTARKIESFPG